MRNLAQVVSKNSIIKALEKALKEKPNLKKSTKFLLKYKGELFPPKEIVRLAAIESGIKLMDFANYRLNGGPPTNGPLEKMGFEIIQFTDWSTNENKSIEKRIARLCWNFDGWIRPSGIYGKSTNKTTHEATHGYGHEEWLFDVSKIINGYHYGFLEPIRKQQDAYENKAFNVWFYSINGESKKRYWIGEIKNLEVLNKKDADKVKEEYIKRGWFNETKEQIIASGANTDGFSNWKGVELFNVRYRPLDLFLNDPYFEIPKLNPINKQPRYSFAHFVEEFNIENVDNGDTFSFKFSEDQKESKLSPHVYIREPKEIEITYLHREISNALTKELRKKYGYKNVMQEHFAGYGANKIDILVKEKDDYIFYEIKSYTSLRISIREAIGQLMEYALWRNQKKAAKLIVITQPTNDFQNAKVYFKHLRNTYNLPLYYQSFDPEKNILSELV